MAGEWRPTETAPRDTEVILGWKGQRRVTTGMLSEYQDGCFWEFDPAHAPSGDPTHWMPLPEPPAHD